MQTFNYRVITQAVMGFSFVLPSIVLAATPVHLYHQSASGLTLGHAIGMQESSRNMDFRQTLHIRVRETFKNYPVLGANAVIHVPQADKNLSLSAALSAKSATLNGWLYQQLEEDLKDAPSQIFTDQQQEKALTQAIHAYAPTGKIAKQKSQLMIYLDETNKAHWAFKVDFITAENNKTQQVSVLLDANTLKPIRHSVREIATFSTMNLKPLKPLTAYMEEVKGGGIGGNEKTGMIYYDGLSGENHAQALTIMRNPMTKMCYLQNRDIIIRDWNQDLDVVQFPCEKPDPNHNGVYWNAALDMTNGSYNPANDAFYAAQVANAMYQSWYSMPTWYKNDQATKIMIFIHANRSFFDYGGLFPDPSSPWYVGLSDGDQKTYAWSTLDVVSHFIAEGNALSTGWFSWGVGDTPSIAFSLQDIWAKATEFYLTSQNNWTIGADLRKGKGMALRYMATPTQDCEWGQKPGEGCSIEHLNDFKTHKWIKPEYGSGLINKAFYLLATSPGWDTKKAFEVFMQARNYWSDWDFDWDANHGGRPFPEEPPRDVDFSFSDVGCTMVQAAQDYQYDTQAIIDAFSKVGIDVNKNVMC